MRCPAGRSKDYLRELRGVEGPPTLCRKNMTMITVTDLNPAIAQQAIKCALTGDDLAKGDHCFWVQGVGVIRADLDPNEVVSKLNGLQPPPQPLSPQDRKLIEETAVAMKADLASGEVPYQDLCEVLACELEAALVELKRRGIDYHFDTDGLVEYRDLHPRQDS